MAPFGIMANVPPAEDALGFRRQRQQADRRNIRLRDNWRELIGAGLGASNLRHPGRVSDPGPRPKSRAILRHARRAFAIMPEAEKADAPLLGPAIGHPEPFAPRLCAPDSQAHVAMQPQHVHDDILRHHRIARPAARSVPSGPSAALDAGNVITPAARAEHGFKFGKAGSASKSGCDEGEVFVSLTSPASRPDDEPADAEAPP